MPISSATGSALQPSNSGGGGTRPASTFTSCRESTCILISSRLCSMLRSSSAASGAVLPDLPFLDAGADGGRDEGPDWEWDGYPD